MSVLYPYRSREASRSWPHVPPALWLMLALVLAAVLAFQLHAALQSPGQAIRGELEAAAADLQSPRATPSAETLARLRHHFRGHDVTVDATFWPLVSVTFHGVDAAVCRDAVAKAERVEGLVVIALRHNRASRECGDGGDMTWQLMP